MHHVEWIVKPYHTIPFFNALIAIVCLCYLLIVIHSINEYLPLCHAASIIINLRQRRRYMFSPTCPR